MRDEEYEFYSDCREKKSIANSAFKRRTHCGKGGRVRLPSDNLTKKELNAMNGETKSYRLNEPMKWENFKEMPADLRAMYLKLLIQKYNVSATNIATMMGVCFTSVVKEAKRLGITFAQRNRFTKWDKDGWYAWLSGTPKPAEEVTEAEAEEIPFTQKPIGQIVEEALANEVEEETPEDEPAVEIPEKKITVKVPGVINIHDYREERKRCIPTTGNMVFEGLAEDVLETVRMLLGGAKVHLSVTWDVLED